MALDYMVALATDRSVSEISALVNSTCFSGDISGEAIATSLIDGVSVRRGLFIRVSTARSPTWGDPIEEEFGFKPTVSIFLRLDKTEVLDAQVTDMLFIATKLFAATSDGMIVYFLESGDVWAIRRAGCLEINSADYMWTPERIEMLHQPYTLMSYVL
ncbi:SitI3 family protein [Nocardia rhizosphaerae]|uniref:SitI3 family protein n=1 Tax=Nocardia rhizosphaerae TaxID=1691571 RepID=A0ABV8L9R4_9NOCA